LLSCLKRSRGSDVEEIVHVVVDGISVEACGVPEANPLFSVPANVAVVARFACIQVNNHIRHAYFLSPTGSPLAATDHA
jgi:hypothetical protein